MIAKQKIALVHVAKAKVGMTDEEYRDLLSSVGVASSKDLDTGGFRAVMDHFETIGFRSTGAARIRKAAESRQPLMKKIGALLSVQELPWSYADGIAKRMFRVHRCEWCQPQQLLKIVAALVYRQRKQEAEEARRRS